MRGGTKWGRGRSRHHSPSTPTSHKPEGRGCSSSSIPRPTCGTPAVLQHIQSEKMMPGEGSECEVSKSSHSGSGGQKLLMKAYNRVSPPTRSSLSLTHLPRPPPPTHHAAQ